MGNKNEGYLGGIMGGASRVESGGGLKSTGILSLEEAGTQTVEAASPPTDMEVLLTGGGGGGASGKANGPGCGGGGAGEITYASGVSFTEDVTITVGAGGAGGGFNANAYGSNGGQSTFSPGGVMEYNAVGGGGGGKSNFAGKNSSGGSGGGGGAFGKAGGTGAFSGGLGSSSGSSPWRGGGGGGANGSGVAGNSGGHGGAATTAYSDWGIATSTGYLKNGTAWFGQGGGAGGGSAGGSAANGGGDGGSSSSMTGGAGVDSTGSGGGGGGHTASFGGTGGAGGKGVVIVRYSGSPVLTGGDTTVESGGYTYHTFLGSGTLTQTVQAPSVPDTLDLTNTTATETTPYEVDGATSAAAGPYFASTGITSGKHYWEVDYASWSSSVETTVAIGVYRGSSTPTDNSPWFNSSGYYGWYANKTNNTSTIINGALAGNLNGTVVPSVSGGTFGVLLDADNHTVTVYVDGVVTDEVNGMSTGGSGTETYFPFFGGQGADANRWTHSVNLGQRAFSQTVPTGATAGWLVPSTETLTLPQLSWGGITGRSVLTEGSAPLAVDTFATFDATTLTAGSTLSNNDLTVDHGTTYGQAHICSTLPKSSGKYYSEHRFDAGDANKFLQVAVTNDDGASYESGYWSTDGTRRPEVTAYGNSFTAGDIIGIALDADTGTTWYSKNGVWQNSAVAGNFANGTDTNYAHTGMTGPFRVALADATNSDVGTVTTSNFGQDATFNGQETPGTTYTDANGLGEFYYEPPAGFVGLYTTTGSLAVDTFATLDTNFRGGLTGEVVSENDLKYYCPPNVENYVAATLSKTTGKWYFECLYDGSTNNSEHGIVGWTYDDISQATTTSTNPLDDDYGGMFLFDGRVLVDAAAATSTLQATSANDVFAVAFDADTREIWFSVNGTWVDGDPGTGTAASSYGTLTSGKTYIPFIGHFSGTSTRKTQAILNFGQDATFTGQKSPGTTYTDANGLGEFYSEPPAGFVGLYTTTGGSAAVPGDDNWDDVSLLIRGDTLTDLSANGHTLTANGNAAAGDASPVKFASGSLTFDGTGDYITVPDDASLDFGSGDFTVELWVYHNGALGNYESPCGNFPADNSPDGFYFASENTGKMRFLAGDGSWQVGIVDTANLPINQWVHLAATREDNKFTLWVNGVSRGTTTTTSFSISNNTPLYVGVHTQSGVQSNHYWNGNIEDLRVTKGVARYTSNFTPPTASFPTSLPVATTSQTLVNTGIFTLEEIYELTKSN